MIGINPIRTAFKRINERLPERLRIDRATGHSGRHSFTSASINAGTDVNLVSLATKHKSSDALKKYMHLDDDKRVQPALNIAKSVFQEFENKSNADEEEEN